MTSQVRQRLLRDLQGCGFAAAEGGEGAGEARARLNANSANHALLRAVLCAGLYPRVCKAEKVTVHEYSSS